MEAARVLTEGERKLVAALRSGNYAQGRYTLRQHAGGGVGEGGYRDSFCCLGVACDAFDPTLWTGTMYQFGSEALTSMPPKQVQDWLGWRTVGGRLKFSARDGYVYTLDGLNDDGFSFSQIADIIAAGLVESAAERAAALEAERGE